MKQVVLFAAMTSTTLTSQNLKEKWLAISRFGPNTGTVPQFPEFGFISLESPHRPFGHFVRRASLLGQIPPTSRFEASVM